MRIGSLELASNLFLSPLAGYTNLPFRLVVREIGGVGLCTTDLVNARSLLEKRDKAFKLIETRPADSPLAVQLFGSIPEEMRDAAAYLESVGIASVDINMGCPVRKVCKVGGGSAMMTELTKTAALVKGMVDAVKIPVTAKMRLGWDDQNITAPDLARALEDVGVAAIFIHGRTREQGFSGSVNLAGIRSVVQAVKNIPVIGNGDIITPQAAQKMFDETGCAGVSIGRGAFYDPWIFQRTLQFLRTAPVPGRSNAIDQAATSSSNAGTTSPSPPRSGDLSRLGSGERFACRDSDSPNRGKHLARAGAPLGEATGPRGPSERERTSQQGRGEEALRAHGENPFDVQSSMFDVRCSHLPPEPPFTERIRVMSRHLDLMVEVFGEELGCRMFRKVAPWYSKRFGPAAEFNRHAVQISTRAQFHDVLENYLRWRQQFLDDTGELKPKFQPPPLVASFMQEPGVAQRQHIPVPKGPVEVW